MSKTPLLTSDKPALSKVMLRDFVDQCIEQKSACIPDAYRQITDFLNAIGLSNMETGL